MFPDDKQTLGVRVATIAFDMLNRQNMGHILNLSDEIPSIRGSYPDESRTLPGPTPKFPVFCS
tara:strand:+ start:113 stop:301 length:189 start_codon:yes stop_codon:yes gene_type:complete